MGKTSTETVVYHRLDENRVCIPRQGRMNADGIVFASPALERRGLDRDSLRQVANVATLPGIVGASLAMPDIHSGYGFPIGGVAAFDIEDGIISPGGVGYDINCGVRLMATALTGPDVAPRMQALVAALDSAVPAGVGSAATQMTLDRREMAELCAKGAGWAVDRGFGSREDLGFIEDNGCLPGADFSAVSERAFERGRGQVGTLGSGNHFVEVGVVAEVFDAAAARVFGLDEGRVVVTVHTGSRGFGHQICTDFVPVLDKAARRAGLDLPDRQLACAPIRSPEGRQYWAAMAAAANYAFANRQILGHRVREAFDAALGIAPKDLGLRLVYDVCHNIAKQEKHVVEGRERTVCVHRKGATRALPAGHPLVPASYRDVGQPVLVPGDMGRASFVLVGLPGALEMTFGSSCHGAGRLLSRAEAIRCGRGRDVRGELESAGIVARAAGRETLAEEMPEAYKDVVEVVEVTHRAGIARKVARLRPLGVVKG